jgi:ATP-dependent Lon protease
MSLLSKIQPKKTKVDLPLVPLRDLIIFPRTVSPVFLGRAASIKAVDVAMAEDRKIALVPQIEPLETPEPEDLHTIATVCHILQVLKLPDGSVRVLVEGQHRAKIQKIHKKGPYLRTTANILENRTSLRDEIPVLMQTIQKAFDLFKEKAKKFPKDKAKEVKKAETPDTLIDLLVPHLSLNQEKKLEFYLEEDSLLRLENLAVAVEMQNEVLDLQDNIQKRVKDKLERNQKEWFLGEQLKEIQKELGHEEDDPTGVKDLKKRIEEKNLPLDVREKTLKEIGRLSKLQPSAPEAGILRTYVEWIADIPWRERTKEIRDLRYAEYVLDHDHFDMKKPKERVLDFIAVRQIQKSLKGPILCFVGPPGTGKTSLGRSVAKSLGRNFVRISLGGVRDEAEIRGHRKTYVGALPGKIIQSMKKAGSRNPVFLLDEIDKMANDFRGDPAAALLEVLDPEQNNTFTDHYLEVPYDLSEVMFITTANSLHTIPRPLLDRMEVIEIPGYTDREKLEIAKQFIVPKQKKENGLKRIALNLTDNALLHIIHRYTMESGVRGLERTISKVMRKLTRKLLTERPGFHELLEAPIYSDEIHQGPSFHSGAYHPNKVSLRIAKKDLIEILGEPPVPEQINIPSDRPGFALGLYYSEVGGGVVPVEVALFKGKGKVTLTGSLGDVMKESAQIAHSYLKSIAADWGIDPARVEETDVHIHCPEGAMPKDGPSAGITMITALLSAFLDKPALKGLAMTGEITLSGRVLPIGGLKEKILGAYRNQRTIVFFPEENRRNIKELPEDVMEQIQVIFSEDVNQALRWFFGKDKLPQ